MENKITSANNRLSRLERLKHAVPREGLHTSDIVDIQVKDSEKGLPAVIKPAQEGVDLAHWVSNNRALIDEHLHRHGAILFSGFHIRSVDAFQQLVHAYGEELLEYKIRSSPRHAVKDNIYTSTDHPSNQYIQMHNEHSYSHQWPMKLWFFALQPSESGGQTPIADSRKVLARISASTRKKFEEKGIMFVRNMGGGLGLGWEDVFQTEDKDQIEEYCQRHDISYEWVGDRLKLTFRKPPIRRHPETGEEVWFNHAFFFNIHAMENSIKEVFLKHTMTDEFPFLSYYGDGSEIEKEVIDEIKEVYEGLKASFDWQQGDVLLIDNMLCAHGRNPYAGERKILIGMCQPYEPEK